jgi:Leucine-rich repeat (LRR) protein
MFPSEIGNLKELTVLLLNHNKFSGTFPPDIATNLELRILCLDDNNFTGILPEDIEHGYDCV